MSWKHLRGPAVAALLVSTATMFSCADAGLTEAAPGVEQAILSTFEQINAVPRCSKNEARISAWLVGWADHRKLQAQTDALHNVLITVPATTGWEGRPAVVLQAHMDMVCIRNEGSAHDFTRDPVPLIREGDWIRARDTTLGADNGIGMALALTLAEHAETPHPKLELLFTVDEEKDMTGAAGLKSGWLTGTRLVNLDSEDDAMVTLGAAGGIHTDIALPLERQSLSSAWQAVTVQVSGLLGGHSGMEINKNRANANVILAQLLTAAGEFRLVEITGGSADNAIATSAAATFAIKSGGLPKLEWHVASFRERVRAQYPAEAGTKIVLTPAARPSAAASVPASVAAVRLIAELPQGVVAWSSAFSGLPETSNNVGIVSTDATGLSITTNPRSFDAGKMQALSAEIASLAQAAGASSSQRSAFPAWPPNGETKLYKAVLAAYVQLTGTPMSTEIIHAGLECGYIAAQYPMMEIVSIGPTIQGVHTTGERLKVSSLARVWNLLQLVLQAP